MTPAEMDQFARDDEADWNAEFKPELQPYASRVRELEAEGLTTSDAQSVAEVEIEEDAFPKNVCGNCLGTNRVRFDAWSDRRLCIECEPHPRRAR